jgi:chromosome segregation ATPase
MPLESLQKELDRWRRRERRLLTALEQVEEERRRLELDMDRVEQQVAYYDNLTREMKKELRQPGISSLLSSLRRG